jgi:general stress protein YciG
MANGNAREQRDRADGGAAAVEASVVEAGRKGGETVRDRYGSDFYGQIGRKGGSTTKRKYGAEHYAAIGRRGGKQTAARHGQSFYETIGRKGGQRVRELIERGKRES